MSRTAEDSKELIEALKSEFDVHSYSGRGMYGKCCVSVHGSSAWEIAKYLFSETWDGIFDFLPEPHEDSLGLGRVFYWPSYEWPADSEDEEDAEESEE
jgi:hypothetical protein